MTGWYRHRNRRYTQPIFSRSNTIELRHHQPTNGAPHRARTRSPTRHSDDPIPVRPQYILGLRPNELPFSHGLKPKSNRRSVHGSPRIPRSPRPIQIAIDRCVMHTCSLRRVLGHQGHHMDMDLDW